MTTENEEYIEQLWKNMTDSIVALHVALIKIRNHLPNGTLKKNLIKDIDDIRAQINKLELGSRGK
jgi:hypothetical protein